MTNFISVSTGAARIQDISLNPQKLAGQCAKLKCCLNYEIDSYVESQRKLPSKELELETTSGTFYFAKADILKGEITYSSDKNILANVVTIPAKRAFEIINMNKRGEKPDNLLSSEHQRNSSKPIDLVEQESLTRFDKHKNSNKKKKKKGNKPQPQAAANVPQDAPANNGNEGRRQENKKPNKQHNHPQRKQNNHEKQGNRQPQDEKNQA